MGTNKYTYNGFGELKTSLDPKQQLRKYDYDTLGRLEFVFDVSDRPTATQRFYDNGPSGLGQLSWSYTSGGVRSNPQLVEYSYEAVNAEHRRAVPESVTYTIDGTRYTAGFHYDDLARIDTIDYPAIGSGPPIRAQYHYDPASGALSAVTEIGTGTDRPIWQIDSAYEGHLISQETFGNGAVTTTGYDPDRRWLTSLHTTQRPDQLDGSERLRDPAEHRNQRTGGRHRPGCVGLGCASRRGGGRASRRLERGPGRPRRCRQRGKHYLYGDRPEAWS